MKCNRQQGGSCRDCECRLPETGWLPCPELVEVLVPANPPSLSGDMCHSCGNFAMVRTGTCLTCQACGDASGGCS